MEAYGNGERGLWLGTTWREVHLERSFPYIEIPITKNEDPKILSGRPERTRTVDLYRVKVAL